MATASVFEKVEEKSLFFLPIFSTVHTLHGRIDPNKKMKGTCSSDNYITS